MKKTISAILVVVMLCAMLTAFTGCSNEQDKFIGTWEADMDLAGIVNDSLSQAGMEDYFAIDVFAVTMVMSFQEDGTYTVTLDETTVQTAFDGMLDGIKDGVIKMLEEQIAASGLEMTVEEMLTMSGQSLDDLIEQMKTQFEQSGMVSELVEQATFEGNFKVQDGKLFLSDGTEYAVDESIYDTYTLEGNTLTLTEHVGDDSMELGIYPIVFEKAS